MIVKRRTEVTFESLVRTMRPAQPLPHIFCPLCGGETAMVVPEEAAAVCALPVREIYRRVEAGTIHSFESEKGLLWVCLNTGLARGKALEAEPKKEDLGK